MCTLVATLNENSQGVLQNMAEATRHRGPDSPEVESDPVNGIAAARLSIFGDSSASMIFRDNVTGRTVLLNGEIYNYAELWSRLSKFNRKPVTTLESELIAVLYDLFGLDFASQLKGMFAIAIVDNDNLILARDRFGIKPLYYTQKGKKTIVCSEIKGILQHPAIKPELNYIALEETKVFGYISSPSTTFFKSIYQVNPGTVMVMDSTGIKESRSFGRLPKAKYNGSKPLCDANDLVEETRKRLINAVERMFKHGDMTKGVYLSGGLDSSTITMIATKILGYKVPTFTLADNQDATDFVMARKVARALGTDHHEYIITEKDYWRTLPDYVAHYESLMAGGVFDVQGGVAFHLLSQKVAENVKVAFSGEGADELFGGYYWIYTHPLGFSDRIKNNFAGLENNKELGTLVSNLFPEPEDEKEYRRNLFDFLLRGGLSNYHLQSVDRSAGAFGFEIRPIYLDDDLSQWAMELPIDYKVPDKNSTKLILREAFRDEFEQLGLSCVLNRKKMGMPAAIAMLDPVIKQRVQRSITDNELTDHPLGGILGSKLNLLLYDLFEHIFFKGWDHNAGPSPKDSLLRRVWPE